MKDSVVIAEFHILRTDRLPLTLFAENLTRLEDLGDEHRSLAFRSGRQKMQILPDGSAHGTWDADIVLEPGPAEWNRRLDEVFHSRATLRAEQTLRSAVTEREVP